MGTSDKLFGKKKEQKNLTKKWPYCGQSLNNAAFKCNRCNKWVDNEVFNKLCDDDVRLIKDKDLTSFTPTLVAAMVIDLLKKHDWLEEDIQKWEEKALNEKQQFNLLVFNSFCLFNTICWSVRMKKGTRDTIKETLRLALLQGVAQLFNVTAEHAPSLDVLKEQGKALYAKFQAIWDKIPWEASPPSQLEASSALASAIYADEHPNLIRGYTLWVHFMVTCEHMGEEFSKMFLVEEGGFDWQGIAGI